MQKQIAITNYDRYYAHYSWGESLLMTLITAVSNFITIPLVIKCFKLDLVFVGIIGAMSLISSFLYHFGEIYNCVIFLDFGAWHRLDNIFAISAIGLYFLYVTGNIHNNTLLYISFIIAILAQEKDPWNIYYTIGPIILIGLMGICANVYYKIGIPKFKVQYVIKGNLCLFIGSFFFVKGLDEHTDYLRLHHGIWHVFLGISSYYNMNSVIEEHFKPLQQIQ